MGRIENTQIFAVLRDSRFPISPIELIAVDSKPERIRAVGSNGFLLLCVDGNADDASQPGVGVAKTVPQPVNGQGVG